MVPSSDLYHDQLLALARFARTLPPLAASHITHTAEANNPSCGDRITMSLAIRDGVVTAAHGHIAGCAICAAATGLLIRHLRDRPPFAANALPPLAQQVAAWFAHDISDEAGLPFAELAILVAVKQDYRNRIPCVGLPFEAAARAIANPLA